MKNRTSENRTSKKWSHMTMTGQNVTGMYFEGKGLSEFKKWRKGYNRDNIMGDKLLLNFGIVSRGDPTMILA